MMNVKPENKSVEHSAKSIDDYFSGKESNFNSGTVIKKLDFNDDNIKNELNNNNPINNSLISDSNTNENKNEDSDNKIESKEDDDSSIDNQLQKAKRDRQLSFSSGEY